MAPQFVKPYAKTNRNDAADAEAICEAVARPNMRFVPMKNVEQQAVLALHRVRQGFVKARTAQANQIRGLLAAFGLIISKGIAHIARRVPALIEEGANELPGSFRQLMQRLTDHLKELDRQVDELEDQNRAWHRSSELSRRRFGDLLHVDDPQRLRCDRQADLTPARVKDCMTKPLENQSTSPFRIAYCTNSALLDMPSFCSSRLR